MQLPHPLPAQSGQPPQPASSTPCCGLDQCSHKGRGNGAGLWVQSMRSSCPTAQAGMAEAETVNSAAQASREPSGARLPWALGPWSAGASGGPGGCWVAGVQGSIRTGGDLSQLPSLCLTRLSRPGCLEGWRVGSHDDKQSAGCSPSSSPTETGLRPKGLQHWETEAMETDRGLAAAHALQRALAYRRRGGCGDKADYSFSWAKARRSNATPQINLFL